MRELTVMFCDIRTFTPMTESLPTDELVRLLNDLFTDLAQEVLETGGKTDEFIGDSVMAFWNAPLPVVDHARRGAFAALGMRRALNEFLARRPDLEQPVAIGEGVNIAARVEANSRAVGFDIVASRTILDGAPELAWLPLGARRLKGVGERRALFALAGGGLAASEPFRALLARHEALIAAIAGGRNASNEVEACPGLADGILRDPATLYEAMLMRTDDIRALGDTRLRVA